MSWKDPTPDVLAGIREMVFRSAVSASNATDKQILAGTDTANRTFYTSDYRYLIAAMVVMVVDVCVIIPLFLGWWQLGRPVSLSPIEIAKAFRAPLLHGSECNGDVDMLLKEVGQRRARYGAISENAQD